MDTLEVLDGLELTVVGMNLTINATSPTDFIDADRVIRRSPQNLLFFTVIQLISFSNTLLCTIFSLVTQEIHDSLPGALDDIGNVLHRVTGS
uniref:G_PROTEIN_RECEP_F1_2 domain-containing protein n=1 Tax=Heterorhabditis bacteriophora TaxID=37862 RepID=A0A1I7WH13_HETBA